MFVLLQSKDPNPISYLKPHPIIGLDIELPRKNSELRTTCGSPCSRVIVTVATSTPRRITCIILIVLINLRMVGHGSTAKGDVREYSKLRRKMGFQEAICGA